MAENYNPYMVKFTIKVDNIMTWRERVREREGDRHTNRQ